MIVLNTCIPVLLLFLCIKVGWSEAQCPSTESQCSTSSYVSLNYTTVESYRTYVTTFCLSNILQGSVRCRKSVMRTRTVTKTQSVLQCNTFCCPGYFNTSGNCTASHVQNLTLTSKTSTSLRVEWSPPLLPHEVILGYQISYVGLESLDPVPQSFYNTSKLNSTSHSVEIGGLLPYSNYNVSVQTITSVGSGGVRFVQIRTNEETPSAPLNLTVSNKTSHSIEVRWTKPLYSNGILLAYHLFYSGLESNNPVSDAFYHEKHIVMMYSMEEELKKELTGLVPYSMYNITIGAMNSAGLGNLSEATVVRTLHDAPSPPTNVTLANVSTTSVLVEWSNPIYPNGIVDFFHILIFDGESGAREAMNIIPASNTAVKQYTANYSALKPAWEYRIDIAAQTEIIGNSSSITVKTLGVPPNIQAVSGSNQHTLGDTTVINFEILEAIPPVSAENITWYFTSISGHTILSCSNHSGRYSFSSDCLTLTISNVTASDGGLYEVFASTRAGNGSGSSVLSISRVPPQFLTVLANTTLKVSDNHTLVCEASGDPAIVFTWRFENTQIDNALSKYSISSNSTTSVLVLRKLTSDDRGTYSCSASNRFGQKTISAYITVQVPPTFSLFPSATRDVISGEILSMTCSASGEPAPQITWYHRGVLLTEEMSNGTVSINSVITASTTTSRLKVTSASIEDAGLYRYWAGNFLGNESRDITVNVIERPIIAGIVAKSSALNASNVTHGGNITLKEFHLVNLTCIASGLPTPAVKWMKDGIPLTNNSLRHLANSFSNVSGQSDSSHVTSTLTLNDIQLSDSGLYACQAVSGIVSSVLGVNVWTLEIAVSAHNECSDDPCQNGGICLDGIRTYVCQCWANESHVYTGQYCEIESKTHEPPSIIEGPKNMSVDIASSIHLQCKARGTPNPVVTWFRDQKAIEGPQSVGENYTIKEITPELRGVYHCQAENGIDMVKSEPATILISGLAQVSVQIVPVSTRKRRRRAISNSDIIVEQLELLAVNTVLMEADGMNLTIYSIKPDEDRSDQMIVTILSDNTTVPPNQIADASIDPLSRQLQEYSDIFPTVSFLIQQSQRFDGCPTIEDTACGNVGPITWYQTEIGGVAHAKCPCGVNDELINKLQASRVCGGTYSNGAAWEEPRCDVCKFSEPREELCRLGLIENKAQLARELANVTQDTKDFKKEDVSLAVTLLGSVVESSETIQEKEVQIDVLSIVGDLTNISPEVLKETHAETGASNKVLNTVSVIANSANVSVEPFKFSSSSFGLVVEAVNNVDSYYPSVEGLIQQLINNSGDNISSFDVQLPRSIFQNGKNATRISSGIFANSALFQPRKAYLTQTGEVFTLVGSSVLSISVLGTTISGLDDSDRLEIEFSKTEFAAAEGKKASCRFWNFTNDESFGGWDDSGCVLLSENQTTAVCQCNHLTHFALLLDISPEKDTGPPTVNDQILTWVSYIGGCICIVCLVITIAVNIGIKALRTAIYNQLLVQLCLALTGLYSAFILGTFSSSVPVLCGIISALAHYFFLATFLWMASIAVHMFRSITQPFKGAIQNYQLLSTAICWVIPVFIVVFSLAPKYSNYMHDKFCRVYGYSFWIGAVVPFGIIYIFNWIVYITVIICLVQRPNMQKEGGKKNQQTKENLFVGAILSVLFGLGWGFGLLASTDVKVDYVRIPFEWVFTILSCAQGVIIFYIYCLRQTGVSKKLYQVVSRYISVSRKSETGHSSSTNPTESVKMKKSIDKGRSSLTPTIKSSSTAYSTIQAPIMRAHSQGEGSLGGSSCAGNEDIMLSVFEHEKEIA